MRRPLAIAVLLLAATATLAWADPTAPRPAPRRPKAKPIKKLPVDEAGPWLGIEIEDGTRGVRVKHTIEGAPAELAGVTAGDEVLSIDRRPVTSAGDLIARIGEYRTGSRVRLEVARGGKRLILTARLTARLDDQEVLERRLLDKPAPAFEALVVGRDADGKEQAVTLDGLRGKVVVIEFLATWCGPCKTTYGTLGQLQARRRGDGLVVLGISDESAPALRALASQEKLGFLLARDVGAAAQSAFHRGVRRVTPTLFVIDRQGVVRFAGMGAGPTVDHAVFAAERALGEGDRD